MTFYLVTQTTLVEADNDDKAVEKCLEKTYRAEVLTFEVKRNEREARLVTISGARRNAMGENVRGEPPIVANLADEPSGGPGPKRNRFVELWVGWRSWADDLKR